MPAKVVDEYHANKDNQQAEALEREHSQAKSAVLSCHTGGVVLAEGTAFLTWQTVAGRPLVRIGTAVCSFSLSHPCQKQDLQIQEFNSKYSRQDISAAETGFVSVLVLISKLINPVQKIFCALGQLFLTRGSTCILGVQTERLWRSSANLKKT